jgi:hypothetical protein
MDVLRRSARKSGLERIKNEHIKEIMGGKGKPDITDITQKKRLQWYGHVKWVYKGNNGSEKEAGHHRHHTEEKTTVVWPR